MARQAIKSLVKDGKYEYIETGSLISIKKNVQEILIPSEELRISMYPMDYEEFLGALGDTTTIKLLKSFYEDKKPVGDQINRKMMKKFRIYMLVGGMPQSVDEYIRTNNFKMADAMKRDIVTQYKNAAMHISVRRFYIDI